MDIEKIVSELMEELNLKAAHNDDEMYDIMKDMLIPASTTVNSILSWPTG